jgi:hypothetical protein
MPYSAISELPDYIRKKPESTQRQWMAVWNSSYSACMKDGGGASDCESGAFSRANGVIKGAEEAELDDVTLTALVTSEHLRLEKADSRVSYRAASGSDKPCSSCRFYNSNDLSCSVVEGAIDPTWACDLWTEQMAGNALPAASIDDEVGLDWSEVEESSPFQVFVAHAFATDDYSSPQWIPFLPTPGKYQHPTYGEINITKDFNTALVASVRDRIYQDNIPLDVEHETKLSGAVAWIKDMRVNANGSADAYVEWTDRGRALLKGGQFKYISPEWFSRWRDPASGKVHLNVIAGGAITTRPFFKEKVLRALVASETGAQIIESDKEDISVPDPTPTLTPTPPESYTAAEVDEKIKSAQEEAAASFKEQMAGMATQLEAAEALAASEKTARETLATQLSEIQKANRHNKFVELVAGRGGSNDGAPWAGDAEKHVAFLEKLAEQFGEDNEVVVTYTEQQTAIAQQLAQSDAFKELGSSARAVSDPEKQLDALTKSHQAANPNLSFSEAQAAVLKTAEGVRLYEQMA